LWRKFIQEATRLSPPWLLHESLLDLKSASPNQSWDLSAQSCQQTSHSLFVLACVTSPRWRWQLKLFTGFISNEEYLEVLLKFCLEQQYGQEWQWGQKAKEINRI
jgi:hypothetical protein